jgi:hypothetical protein
MNMVAYHFPEDARSMYRRNSQKARSLLSFQLLLFQIEELQRLSQLLQFGAVALG